jgi:glycosyltransferase involved in cell wall biosynthesis
MKVALLGTRGIPPKYGGTETYVENLSLYLAKQGDEIIVYCEKYSKSDDVYSPDKHYPDNIRRIEVSGIPTKHLDNFSRTLFSTLHVCFDSSVHIVQFNNMGPAFFSFLPRLFGKKVVGAIRAIDSQRKKWNLFARIFLQVCEFLILKVPNATTVNALPMQKYYLNKFRAETIYIPNGINIPKQRLKPNGIKKWELGERNYILFAARLEPEKGCHTLITAYKDLVSQGLSFIKLAIAGHKGFSTSYVKDLLRNEDNNIQFLDYVRGELLDELYDNAFAFVLPSSIEGMSNSLLSAMAHGVPVIVSDIPENLALLEGAPFSSKLNDKPGLSFRLEDPSDLSIKIKILLNDPIGATERGILLQSHVKNNFDLETMGHDTRNVYTQLLKEA